MKPIHYVQMGSEGQWKPGIHDEQVLPMLRVAVQGSCSPICACVMYIRAEDHGKRTTLGFMSWATRWAKLLNIILFDREQEQRDQAYFRM